MDQLTVEYRRSKQYMVVNVDDGTMKKMMGWDNLAPNFEVWEFVSTDKSEVLLISFEVVNDCQTVRNKHGKPMVITSGHREIELNDYVDGYVDSEHLYGQAVDCYIKDVSHHRLYDSFVEVGGYRCNVGLYPGHVHYGRGIGHRRAK